MAQKHDIDILSLGEPLMELSAKQEGRLDSVSTFAPGFGGDASNFAVAASRAGGNVGIITRIGEDPFGSAFMDLWDREGIDTTFVQRGSDGPTGLYIISRQQGKHDFTYYRVGSAASLITPAQLPEAAIQKARLLHVTGVTQGISTSACDSAFTAMKIAKEAGTLVSYDPNYRPTLWPLARARAVIHESISMADIVTPSMEEAEMMLGITKPELAAEKYLKMGAGIVALKLGADGALIATEKGMERVAPIHVDPIDCSGAGDAFAGAFVATYLEGRPLDWCARFAIVAAGISTTGLGCVAPIPVRKDILQYMENGS